MLWLEKMAMRRITSANYITSVNGMLHPNRILSEHDFLYMLDGEWEIIENGRVFEMRRDDLLILSAGRHHYGKKLCNPGNRHMYFHVLPTKEETAMENSMEKMESTTMFSCPTIFHCQHHPRIRQSMQELIAVYWSKNASEKTNRLSLLCNLLLCELAELQAFSETAFYPDTFTDEIFRKIRSAPQVFYTAKEIAAAYYISPRTLNNRFQKVYKKTFSACQMETKLEMVRQFLLQQPDAKLHEAALNFGFYDEFHLSKAFKKHFGQPPSLLRNKSNSF